MSGGSLDYVYQKVNDAVDEIECRAKTNLHKAFAKHLRKVSDALHDIEWVFNGDCGTPSEEKAIRACITPTDELKCATEEARRVLAELQAVLKRIE